ncbi:translation initiation factor IF-2 [Haliovirga abyssi]|uniref:Translation initiation factor IF-2 n=1 Tax=Haliovirga abyssi TaxID=2996794 RepID=A0AAU9DCR7_9FUSO|nr:translation initiation factor IF-2 [Haliovirga abyssi]BDU49958.1 translation initiation factor IF-2 [Haliovirga abyssi]
MTHKIRVHELAKEYGISNKDFLEKLNEWDIAVSSHLSGLTEEQVEIIKKKLDVKKSKKEKMKEQKEEQRKAKEMKKAKIAEEKAKEEELKVINILSEITIKELAEKMNISPTEIIKTLFLQGKAFTINSNIEFELVEEIAESYGYLVEQEEKEEETYGEKFSLEIEDKEEELLDRPPVITVMGHVDHGKTSLLDAIKETTVAEGEAGGITQRIGAYQIIKDGQKITFIDTPGHEAFTEMRARGAKVTDIAVLVVAADDGVMPQTIEAIAHAKEAEVPIIVAVNKIDKDGANPMRVKQELSEYDLLPAEWGGTTDFVEISAKKRINLQDLLDTIVVTAEILELKANPKKRAKAVVLESRLDQQRGPVADILMQEGTLKVGDTVIAGESYGKVRAMTDDKGKRIKEALPSQPVEIIGFDKVPEAGDVVYAVQNDKQGKKIVEQMQLENKARDYQQRGHISLDRLHDKIEGEEFKELKLIIKADTRGSVEVLKESISKLSNEEVAVKIIYAAAGAISEGDVKLAEASDAIIIGFNVRPSTKARLEAEKEEVEIRNYNVIYHLTEELAEAIKGMLSPKFKEVYQGRVEIKKVFKITNVGNIGGAVVVDGLIKRNSEIRVLRNGIIVYTGELSSLKRFTSDAKDAIVGQECGIGIANFNDIKEGDIIEAYMMEEIPR